jgi:hypothetical protein
MNMTVMLHDNQIYGLTKMQASPTSPIGTKSNTTPRGSYLEALNPLTVTLGVQNVSFVAQAVDWIPELLYDIISAAFHHKGFSFVRIIQRCPEWLPTQFEPWIKNPEKTLLLQHEHGIRLSPTLAKVYKNQQEHDPANLNRAREIASITDPIPVGILYRNPEVPCYETCGAGQVRTTELIEQGSTRNSTVHGVAKRGGRVYAARGVAQGQDRTRIWKRESRNRLLYLTGRRTGTGWAIDGFGRVWRVCRLAPRRGYADSRLCWRTTVTLTLRCAVLSGIVDRVCGMRVMAIA